MSSLGPCDRLYFPNMAMVVFLVWHTLQNFAFPPPKRQCLCFLTLNLGRSLTTLPQVKEDRSDAIWLAKQGHRRDMWPHVALSLRMLVIELCHHIVMKSNKVFLSGDQNQKHNWRGTLQPTAGVNCIVCKRMSPLMIQASVFKPSSWGLTVYSRGKATSLCCQKPDPQNLWT